MLTDTANPLNIITLSIPFNFFFFFNEEYEEPDLWLSADLEGEHVDCDMTQIEPYGSIFWPTDDQCWNCKADFPGRGQAL